MFDFIGHLVRLLPALTIKNGRIHVPITIDLQDFDGTQIVIVTPPVTP